MRKALVIISDQWLGSGVARLVKDKSDFSVETVFSEETAQDWLGRDTYSLVIVHAALARTGASLRKVCADAGLDLLAWFFGRHPGVPSILIGDVRSKSIARLLSVSSHARFVAQGTNLPEELSRAIADLVTETHGDYLTLTLTANDTSDQWSWRFEGDQYALPPNGLMTVDPVKLRRLTLKSKKVCATMANNPDWHKEVTSLGTAIVEEIFKADGKFWKQFGDALSKVGNNYKNLKICLQSNRNVHDLAIEMVASEDSDHKPWVLSAPIYRQIGGLSFARRNLPLFTCEGERDSRQINCLLIEAEASGPCTINGTDFFLDPLWQGGGGASECDDLENLFSQHRDAFNLGQIDRVSKRDVGRRAYADHVFDLLQKEKWQLVHFAGHSYYDPGEKRGYLFFPTSRADPTPVPVPTEVFGSKLADVRFLYLSSCQSGGGGGFLSSLAQCRVPALLGFSCPVRDTSAKVFAGAFYRQLFNLAQGRACGQKCLQHALARTKEEIFYQPKPEMAWAQTVLMFQSD